MVRLIKEVETLLTEGPDQWADGKKHIGHLWEGFLVPCLQHDETLINPTLKAIHTIWSKTLPTSITCKESFTDSEQAVVRAVEKLLEKHRDKDQDEEVDSNAQSDSNQNQVEKKLKKLIAPTNEPQNYPITEKCFGMVIMQLASLPLCTCRENLPDNLRKSRKRV